jgi:hypothetical protein
MAEFLARYVDKKLRGEKGVSEAETEAVMDKVRGLWSVAFNLDNGQSVCVGAAALPSLARKGSIRGFLQEELGQAFATG